MSRFPGQDSLDHQIVQDLGSGLTLVASQCPLCGDLHFPPRELCIHDLTVTAPIAVSREGVVYEAVHVRLPPAGFDGPYWAAYVDMPEGVRVFAPLRWDRDDDPPHHGTRVQYSIETVRTEPDEIVGPVFRAVDPRASEGE